MEQAARPLNLDETLVDENANAQIMLEDWSGLGRGFHVDFDDDEKVPLEPGMYLVVPVTIYMY